MGRWKSWLVVLTLASVFLLTEPVWAEMALSNIASAVATEAVVATTSDQETSSPKLVVANQAEATTVINQQETVSQIKTNHQTLPDSSTPPTDLVIDRSVTAPTIANQTDKPAESKKPIKSNLPTEPLIEPPVIDFIATPPKLRFVKVQLKDVTRPDGCQEAAEFAIVVNFGTSPAELSDVVFQYGKVGSAKFEAKVLPKISLPVGEGLVIFNSYFSKGSSAGNNCPANSTAKAWLEAQKYRYSPNNTKNGYLDSGHWLKLVAKDHPEMVIDELNLSIVSSNPAHDTLVAQTDKNGVPLFDSGGKLLLRPIQTHLPEQHFLDYGSLIVFQNIVEAPKNTCSGIILSEISVNVAENRQFIEIYNTNEIAVSPAGCRLWTNWSGQNEYTFGDIEIETGESLAVFVKDSNLQFSKLDGGGVELRNELGEVVDKLIYRAQLPGSSWSLLGNEFATSFAPTPNLPNIDLPELDCKTGYVFNKTTGDCQKITIQKNPSDDIIETETVCKPGYEVGFTGGCVKICPAGYERSPESNRCRKIAFELETTLLSCPSGYERNPLTNRCRKITAAAQTGLSPCPVGYERNPETNRCRKISNQQTCDEGYEIGFTGNCVKICESGYERSPESNRCRKLVAQAGESDVNPIKLTEEVANNTPVVSLNWLQLVILGGVLAAAVAWRSRAAIKKIIKKVL